MNKWISMFALGCAVFMVGSTTFALTDDSAVTSFDRYGLPLSPVNGTPETVAFARFRAAAKKGGTLQLSYYQQIRGMFPYSWQEGKRADNGPISDALFESLTTSNPVGSSRTQYAMLAKQFWFDPENSKVTVELNPDARFWDGTAVTAADAKFSWDLYWRSWAGNPVHSFMTDIYGEPVFKVLDERRFELTFKGVPASRFLEPAFYVLGGMAIVKPTKDPQPFGAPYQGTGPYRLKDGSTEFVTLTRNVNYWGLNHPMRMGLFNFDEIRYTCYKDPSIERIAFRGSKVDSVRLSLFQEEQATFEPTMDAESAKGFYSRRDIRIWERDLTSDVLMFNMAKPDTGRLAFREALNWAFDFKSTNRILFSDKLSRLPNFGAKSVYAPNNDLSEDARSLLKEAKTPAPRELLAPYDESGYETFDADLPRRERLRQAMNLLKADGYVTQDGKLMRDGRPIELELMLSDDKNNIKLAGLLEENLKFLGIRLNQKLIAESSRYTFELVKRDYDLVFGGVSIPHAFEGLNMNYLRQQFSSTKAGDKTTPTNLGNVRSPFIDWTLDELSKISPASPRFAPLAELLVRSVSALKPVILIGETSTQTYYVDKRICTLPWRSTISATGYYSDECPN